MNSNIEQLSVATIRSLVIDTINKAKSGHPGMALGSAPALYTLFTKHFNADPTHPDFINRDRFILSAGHASALYYSLFHLCGYAISMDDLKSFRQLGSFTPGHPENYLTKGIDASSGPLGQGLAQAVGFAMAETHLRNMYPEGEKLINHYTYCLCGDGCLEEGISQEALSIAGHNKLNKLILIYDDNAVTLDGNLSLSSSDDVKKRFEAAGWNVIFVKDGNDLEALDKAFKEAKKSQDKPSVIWMKTIIGYGSEKQGTNKVHGNPLGEEDGDHAKKCVYGFDHEPFFVPDEVRKHFEETFIRRGKEYYYNWEKSFAEYQKDNKVQAARFVSLMNNSVKDYLPKELPELNVGEMISTRNASQKALNDYSLSIPNLFGGSADVAGSVMTKIEGGKVYGPGSYDGSVINFGIREFAMAAIQNGILLHGGLRTYVGLFFVFSDYLKPAIRMAALSKIPAIYLLSHDSIAVGEDGPTHQPIEQLAMLRSIPNVNVIRPCDAKEIYGAYRTALESIETPTAIILSRQNLPILENSDGDLVEKGAYIVSKEDKKVDIILIATGSEVSLAMSAKEILKGEKIDVRVVSMPCWELFDNQDKEYKESVIGNDTNKCFSVEMLSSFGWGKYAKHHMSIDEFGLSGKANDVINHFGFAAENLAKKVKEAINK